jgi:hypothetical protein
LEKRLIALEHSLHRLVGNVFRSGVRLAMLWDGMAIIAPPLVAHGETLTG